MILPGAHSRDAPPKKQAECDKFIDHAQIAVGYFCERPHLVSVFVLESWVSEDFFVSAWDDRSDRKSANPMRLLSKPARIGLKSFKIMDFAVVCSGLGFHRPGNIR